MATEPVYATTGLIDVLLARAGEQAPDPTTISVSVTRAAEFKELDINGDTPVFTHFYLPNAGNAVNFVFGVDLGTPVGQTQGRFVSHPEGPLEPTQADDFHEVLFVAVPPWDRQSIVAFDRDNTRRELRLLDVEPPEEVFEE
ncbi:hypothetical protein Hrd1104_06355 [Halorhabdus sp. CBA1104]|uniref:hypothetical protein n=1 Tax=Halorhabdus sp. CBA1104 TaxID=1380432 RepID=UPI0012B2C7FB|nr:hypothetical protein [Halorhabdus sp. CBA1104]QGN06952.1 hypothetical protein Hrd1104_06355 [Halorhabdus sp. CBA1104]